MNISREGAKDAKELDVEELSSIAVDIAFHIHRELEPGLLESVYEAVKEGTKRIVNNHTSFASSRLRVNQDSRP